jgi:hypothetical protein
VTLRRGLKPHGFFRLSSVRAMLRNGAWLRLVAHRSGGGKARKQRFHSGDLFPGRCQARCRFHAAHKGMNGPQLAVGVLGTRNTRAFRRCSPGNIPQGRRLFLMLLLVNAPLPKAVHPMVSCLRRVSNSLIQWFNTVVFLPLALRQRTCTPFSCSRYYMSILFEQAKSGNSRAKAGTCLTAWDESATACGGLKPHPVREAPRIKAAVGSIFPRTARDT